MRKEILLLAVGLIFCTLMLFAGGQNEKVLEKVEIEVIASQPEYVSAEREIWDLYEEMNSNVSIKIISVNEGQEETIYARIAAGNPPHISSSPLPAITPTNYTIFANLLDIDYPYWDELSYNGKTIHKELLGIDNYVPAIELFGSVALTWIYHEDAMEKAGLDPQKMKTWDDVDQFLAKLKVYVDKTPGVDYVFDTAWQPKIWGMRALEVIALSLGANISDLQGVFLGKVDWLDMERNPYVRANQKIKEYYDKGYLPEKFWTRQWESDFENSFIGKKSIFGFHGPWLWTKTMAADPSARLSGLPLPVSNGKLYGMPVDPIRGDYIFAAWVDKPIMEEVKKAFIFWTSPEIAELRSQYLASTPNLKNLSPDYTLDHPQFMKAIKPSMEGAFGDAKWANEAFGWTVAAKYKVEGRAAVMADDATAPQWGRYMEGDITIEELMEYYKRRWEVAYKF